MTAGLRSGRIACQEVKGSKEASSGSVRVNDWQRPVIVSQYSFFNNRNLRGVLVLVFTKMVKNHLSDSFAAKCSHKTKFWPRRYTEEPYMLLLWGLHKVEGAFPSAFLPPSCHLEQD